MKAETKKYMTLMTLATMWLLTRLTNLPAGIKIAVYTSYLTTNLIALRLIFNYYGSFAPSKQTIMTKLFRLLMLAEGVKHLWITTRIVLLELPLAVFLGLHYFPNFFNFLL